MTAPPLRPADRATLDLLHTLCTAGPVAFTEWRAAALSETTNRDSAKRVFNRAVAALQAAGLINRDGDAVHPAIAAPHAPPCPVAHFPESDRPALLRLISEHDTAAARLERLGRPSDLWTQNARTSLAAQLFRCRLLLSRQGLPVAPLSDEAKHHLDAAMVPTHLPAQSAQKRA